ncbi:MAG TPA: hypothetical protein VMD56_10655 [Steroidobacteraceae bacterium]|nr:hypothetical protein [Steroidobacteraceae bacterium]
MVISTVRILPILLVSLASGTAVHAQGPRAAGGPPPSAKAAAPVDLTGYWESLVTTEDWVYRMVTPRPGDYAGVPLKPAGIQVMDAWNPAKDTAAGEQCKSYGAPAIMRVPEHLHITWQDDQTLKMQTDAGEQTRLFHFVPSMAAAHGPRTWQGYSVAQWELQSQGGGRGPPGKVVWGALKVTTDDLKAGYLRKNGVPYSEKTQVMEYYDPVQEDDGDGLLVVTSFVTDPVYLFGPFVTDNNFLKLSSAAGWEPSACSAMW